MSLILLSRLQLVDLDHEQERRPVRAPHPEVGEDGQEVRDDLERQQGGVRDLRDQVAELIAVYIAETVIT